MCCATPLLEGFVDDWLDLNVALGARLGVPADTARTHARLGIAVVHGLLLDLLATGDRAGADAAIEAFAAGYPDGWPAAAGTNTQSCCPPDARSAE